MSNTPFSRLESAHFPCVPTSFISFLLHSLFICSSAPSENIFWVLGIVKAYCRHEGVRLFPALPIAISPQLYFQHSGHCSSYESQPKSFLSERLSDAFSSKTRLAPVSSGLMMAGFVYGASRISTAHTFAFFTRQRSFLSHS